MLTRLKPFAMKSHDFISGGVKQSVITFYVGVHMKLFAFKTMKPFWPNVVQLVEQGRTKSVVCGFKSHPGQSFSLPLYVGPIPFQELMLR